MKKKEKILPYLILIFAVLFAIFIQKQLVFANNHSVWGDGLYHYTNQFNLIKHIEKGDVFGFYEHFNSGYPMMNQYQPLYYLAVVAIFFLFLKLIPLLVIHNTLFVIIYSLTPVGVFYLLSKFRFNKMVCAIGSLLSILPIGVFGHSLEAYHGAALLTLSLATLLYFFTLGKFHEFVYYNKRNITDYLKLAILISLSSLAHQWVAYLIFITFTIYIISYLFHAKIKEILSLIKPLLIISLISLVMISFWFVPKLITYKEFSISTDSTERVDNAFYAFSIQMFVEKYFNGELLDSTNNFGEIAGENFRWPDNLHFYRFPILTVFSILGFIMLLFRLKDFKSKFLIIFFIISAALMCGFDDIQIFKFLPIFESVAFIRFIFLFDLAAIILSAFSIYYIVNFAQEKVVKFYKIKNNNRLFQIIATIALLLLLFYSPLKERYSHTRTLMGFKDQGEISEFKTLLESNNITNSNIAFEYRDQNDNVIYNKLVVENIPKIYGNSVYSTIVFSEIDFMRSMARREMIISDNLLNLFNIDYVITSKDTDKKLPNTLNLIDENSYYKLYKHNKKENVFEFSNYKPYIGIVDNFNHLNILNHKWIESYKIKLIPPVIYNFELDKELIDHTDPAGILYFKQQNNPQDYKQLRELISKDIHVISNTNLPGALFFNPEEDYAKIDLVENTIDSSYSISNIKNKINYYSAQVYTEKSRLLLFKKTYTTDWNVYINKIPAKNIRVSPYFNAVLIPEGEHFIEYKFQKRFYENLLLTLSIGAFLISIVIILINKYKKKGRKKKGRSK